MGLESYLAVCLRAADGTHLGHMARDGRGADGGRGRRRRGDADLRVAGRGRARAPPAGGRVAALARTCDRGRRFRAPARRTRPARRRAAAARGGGEPAQGGAAPARQSGDEPVDVLRLASDELEAAQTELRDLARGLHPVALSERGLRSALESLTVGYDTPVDARDRRGRELPDDVELAAYFIVCESLTNARKYAAPDAVRVRVAPWQTACSWRSRMTAGRRRPGIRDWPARARRPGRRAGRPDRGRQPARRGNPRQRPLAAASPGLAGPAPRAPATSRSLRRRQPRRRSRGPGSPSQARPPHRDCRPTRSSSRSGHASRRR